MSERKAHMDTERSDGPCSNEFQVVVGPGECPMMPGQVTRRCPRQFNNNKTKQQGGDERLQAESSAFTAEKEKQHMDQEMMTANQIVAARPGWTRELVTLAMPEPDGHLGPEYNHAPLYAIDRVEAIAATDELERLREQAEAEAARQEAEREARAAAKRQRQQQKLAALASPTPASMTIVRNALMQISQADGFTDTEREVYATYDGSDGAATRRLYSRLERAGDCGPLAAYLLRAQKASTRAKRYRGDARGHGYGHKEQALEGVCSMLSRQPCQKTIPWGWGLDECQPHCPNVLYIDLPNGQVSFHAPERGEGPDYPGEWDGEHASQDRILEFAAAVLLAAEMQSGSACARAGEVRHERV